MHLPNILLAMMVNIAFWAIAGSIIWSAAFTGLLGFFRRRATGAWGIPNESGASYPNLLMEHDRPRLEYAASPKRDPKRNDLFRLTRIGIIFGIAYLTFLVWWTLYRQGAPRAG